MNEIAKTGHANIKEHSTGTGNDWYDCGIRFCLYAMAAAVPAIFTPALQSVFSMPKLIVLRLLTAMIMLLFGCKIYVEGKVSYGKSKLNILLLVYGVVSILNTIFSITPFTSIYGAENHFTGIFTVLNFLLLPFFVYNFLCEEKTVKIFIKISLWTAGILAFYGLLQYAGVFNGIFNWTQDPADRVFGTVGQSNHFGAYLGMNFLLGVFFFTYVKKNKSRWLLGLGLLLMLVTLCLTASRGAIFATFFALLVCGLIAAIRNYAHLKLFFKKTAIKIVIGIILLLVAAGLVTGQIQKLSVVERTVGTVNFVSQGNIPDRLSWWLSTLQMIKDRPLLGFGLSAYRDIYNAYRRTDYVAPGPGEQQDLITPEAAHNEYLDIAATQGLIGLAAFLAIIIFIFWKLDELTTFNKRIDDDFYLALGVKGAIMVYLVQVFVSFGVITTLTFFFLLLGLAAAIAAQASKVKTFTLGAAARFALSFILILLCCLLTYMTLKEGLAEYYYKQAQVDEAGGNLRAAIEDYQRAALTRPGEYAYLQAFGDFALKNSKWPGLTLDARAKMLLLAEANYSSAAAVNPHHPSTFYNLGIVQLELYKMTGKNEYLQTGAGNLKQAVALAVNNPMYPYQAAKALLGLYHGSPEAYQYLTKALQIRPGYRDAEQLLKQIGTPDIAAPATATQSKF